MYGGADYSSHLPPHSYIDARDFLTARDLASYLLWLVENPAEYLKYFMWKSHYQIVEEISPEQPHSLPASFSCNLCQYLNTEENHKQISDLKRVWEDDAECVSRYTYHCNRDREEKYPLRKGLNLSILLVSCFLKNTKINQLELQ